MRNDSLRAFLQILLVCNGIHIFSYEGEEPDIDDVLITDDPLLKAWPGRAIVLFSRHHIGVPVEREDRIWLHSLASPHELISLLALHLFA